MAERDPMSLPPRAWISKFIVVCCLLFVVCWLENTKISDDLGFIFTIVVVVGIGIGVVGVHVIFSGAAGSCVIVIVIV
jgi:hypothetical protein